MKHPILPLAFIGAGNMAEAIARSLLKANLATPPEMFAVDPSADRRKLFSTELHVRSFESAKDLPDDIYAVLLAVKPQTMESALASIERRFPQALYISIAAGITTARIESHLPGRPVVRVMPNTPLMVGHGATAIAPGKHATAQHLDAAEALFKPSGVVVRVREDQMDAVTAVSGSGPAYFFFLVEQMIRAAVDLGLEPQTARTLATQTALGAGAMLTHSADEPAELRRKVTSPGGTTQAAIEHLISQRVDQAIIDAIRKAAARGRELGSK